MPSVETPLQSAHACSSAHHAQAYLLSDGAAGEAGEAEQAAGAAAEGAGEPGDSAAAPGEPGSLMERIRLPPPATAALLAATGAVAGVASGLLGVG